MYFFAIFFCVLGFSCCGNYYVDLASQKWSVTNSNGSIHIDEVKIPGVIHTHLLKAGIISDPYFRYNDVLQRWIGDDVWTYEIKSFEVEKVYSRMELVFEGLDTVAEIMVNGKIVSSVENMFHEQRMEVQDHLKVGSNSLSIKFESPIKEAKKRHDSFPYIVPAADAISTTSGVPYRNFLRKEHWDWGPAFTPSGVYKDVFIVGYSSMELTFFSPNVDCLYQKNKNSALCSVIVDLGINSLNVEKGVSVKLAVKELGISKEFTIDVKEGDGTYRIVMDKVFQMEDKDMWWPNGFGEANLFELSLDFSNGLDVDSKMIGFREIKVVMDNLGGQKESFYFQVNGIPIFAKGSNFIPMDSFEDKITDNDINNLLLTAKESNMNMVRIWGGGLYQRDSFYDYCDKYGLMVWQEFMFACALYPSDSNFLQSVGEEIRYQMNRLKHHPSIALWSGSNENEASIYDKTWYPGYVNSENKIMYGIDYGKLYFNTIRPIVVEIDPIRFFWPSSPSNGYVSTDPYQGKWTNPYSFDQGDVHYYNYIDKCTDVSNFPKGKFISEYGWQSYPSFTTLSHVVESKDYSIQGDLMMHRQHHPFGVEEILAMLGRFFKPTDVSSEEKKFKSNIYLSQLLQSFCIKAETEYYRTLIESDNTMGALYWQMNSIWQAPTWSSLEYGGKWKILHYDVKKFFSPILITSYELDGNFYVYVVSDVVQDTNVQVNLKSMKWDNGQIAHEKSKEVEMKYLEVNQIVNMPKSQFLKDFNCSTDSDCYLLLTASYENSNGETVVNDNYHLFSPLFDVFLQKPNIKYTLSQTDDNVQINMVSSAIAPFVYLDVDCFGVFSENGFFLYPNVNKTIVFDSRGGSIDFKTFQNTFEAISVRDTYVL